MRNTLSGNAFLGKGFFSNYITKDISLAYGGLFVVVDNLLAPQTHQYDIGVQFSLNLPGTVNFSVYAQKETHHVTQDFDLPVGDFRHVLHAAGTEPRARPVRLPVHRRSGLQVGAAPRTGDPRAADLPADLAADVVEQLHRRHLPEGHRPLGSQRRGHAGLDDADRARRLVLPGRQQPAQPVQHRDQDRSVLGKPPRPRHRQDVLGQGRPVGRLRRIRYWSNKFGTDHNAGVFTVLAPNTSIESTAFFGTTYHFTN